MLYHLPRGSARARSSRRWVLPAAGLVAVALVTLVVVLWPQEAERRLPESPGTMASVERWDGATHPDFESWLIEYDTATRDDEVTGATALVLAAKDRPAGPRPVLAWAHGTTGVAEQCAPSLTDAPFGAQSILIAEMLSKGWVVVATDYAGLGSPGPHAYLVGTAAAHDVLDSVRAARGIGELELSDRTVVWGGSQGGHAALWTGAIAPSYAPGIDLVGVAAVAPATELEPVIERADGDWTGRTVVARLLGSWKETFPENRFWKEVDPDLRRGVERVAGQCAGGQLHPEANELLSDVETPLLPPAVMEAGLAELLRANTPTQRIAAPVLVIQGEADTLVPVEIQDEWVATRCAAGQPIDYRTYDGLDHVSVLAPGSPANDDLVGWTEARLAGEAPTPTCRN